VSITGRDLVSASLRLIGALASGESLGATESTDGLAALNRLISSWSTESLLIYSKVREAFSLTAGQQAYTMGTSGNFNTSRPIKIEAAAIQIAGASSPMDLPLKIRTLEQWTAITSKSIQSTIPTELYPEGTNPLETLNLWPIPSANQTLVLWSWKALTSFTDINTSVDFPPGYERALIFNLAIDLAPEFGRPVSDAIAKGASESKENIERMNSRPRYLKVDDSLLPSARPFNWITGDV
jgi:hypothetical protein